MVKRVFYAIIVLGLITSCNNQNTTSSSSSSDTTTVVSSVGQDSTSLGVIEFEGNTYDFGTVKEGEVVEHVFKFKNTGSAPVILAQVSASCGCTTPDYSKEPILPGKEGEVKVSFDTKGQVGTQQKIVTIVSNAENKVTSVQIKGKVER